ncbi:MAG TPA: hypothetical protein VJC18_03960, partial [bacterium]|nr:hypothetical protein [bacterium]
MASTQLYISSVDDLHYSGACPARAVACLGHSIFKIIFCRVFLIASNIDERVAEREVTFMNTTKNIFLNMLIIAVIALVTSCGSMDQTVIDAGLENESVIANDAEPSALITGSFAEADVGNNLIGFSVAFQSRSGSFGDADAFACGDFNGDGVQDYAFSDAA